MDLNIFGTVQRKWPEISKILEKTQEEIKPNKNFWSKEIKFSDGRIKIVETKIKNRKLASEQNSMDLWAWTQNSKYYEKKTLKIRVFFKLFHVKQFNLLEKCFT